jgi:hypothetical protein
MITDDRTCPGCGKSLAGKRPTAKTCSGACRVGASRARRSPGDAPKIRSVCPTCKRGRWTAVTVVEAEA